MKNSIMTSSLAQELLGFLLEKKVVVVEVVYAFIYIYIYMRDDDDGERKQKNKHRCNSPDESLRIAPGSITRIAL